MKNTIHHQVILACGAQLVLLLGAGCSEASSVAAEDEATLDRADIVITYDEGSSIMAVHVDLDPFARLAPGSTIEMSLDVTFPDGTRARHERGWTSGEDLDGVWISVPAADMGHYEVDVTSLALDGRMILDGPTLHQSMDLLEQLKAPRVGVGGLAAPGCKQGITVYGTFSSDILFGSEYNDVMYGYFGSDILAAGLCDDILWGGEGNDTLHAYKGLDKCYGGPGVDKFVDCEVVIQD